MTEWLQAFWLALLQGITEFLPISSSGHLALVPALFDWPDQGLPFDVAIHVGTLTAIVIYFRKDLALILGDWIRSLYTGQTTIHSKLAWFVVFTTVLTGIAGLALEEVVINVARKPVPIAIATLVFGIVLGMTDRLGRKTRVLETLGWKDVFVIGSAQVLALIPGTSRSGITISAGLMLGLTREAATRFSFLMAIPIIALAGIWQTRNIIVDSTQTGWQTQWGILVFAALVSAIVAFVCVHYFLQFVQRFSLMPFVIYRLILGVILLALFL